MKNKKSKQRATATKSFSANSGGWQRKAALPTLFMLAPMAAPALAQDATSARPGAQATGQRAYLQTTATPLHFQGSVNVAGNSQSNSSPALNIGSIAGLNAGRSLDLGSVATNVVLSSQLFGTAASVTLNVGGNPQTFVPGQLVTAGIFVAAKQVLTGTAQTLNLTQTGTATGGTFSLNSVISPRVNEIVIPQNVSALSVSTNHNPFRATDIINYGSIYVAPQSIAGNSARLSASEINNLPTGLISSDFSAGAFSSMGYANSINLALHALNNITNYGTISSSGSLNLSTTYGAISNLSSGGGQQPVMSAATDLSMSAGNGYIVNAGLAQALAGNINIASANTLTDLNILATAGTFKALMGDINIRDAAYKAATNINMTGGDYLSKTLNIFAGTGAITGTVGELTGCLNTSGNAAHFIASTPLLHLGNNSIKGDPLYVNTAGSISISGVMDVTATNEPLAIIASGNITGDSTAQIVNHGGSVVLIAGAKISSYSGTNQFPTAANGSITINDVSVSSTSGGNIDFTTSTASTVIDTSSPTNFSGKVTLVALSNGSKGGQVLFPTSSTSIDASSPGSISSSVLVLANSTSGGTSISLGKISTASAGIGGSVDIFTQAPAAAALSFDATGNITGSITPSGSNVGNQSIVLGTITTSGAGAAATSGAGATGGDAAPITISASKNVTVNGSLLAFGGGGSGGAGTTVAKQVFKGGQGGVGSSISVNAGGSINVSGDINTSGGGGGGGGAAGTTGDGAPGGLGGGAGSITVQSQTGDVFIGGSLYAAAGGNGGSGGTAGTGVAGGGGGGGSFGGGGGAGGGTGALVAGTGGGGGAGYTVLTGPDAFVAAGGGGAGGSGVGVINNGGGGGGAFGPGKGGVSSDPTVGADGGDGGTGIGFGIPGLQAGGDGGNYSGSTLQPGLGGVFFAIPLAGLGGLSSSSVGGAGGSSGGGGSSPVNGQNVQISAASGGDIVVTGGSLSIGSAAENLGNLGAASVYGNNIFLLSTSSSKGSTGITLGKLYDSGTGSYTGISLNSTGKNLTLISAGDISYSAIYSEGQSTDFTMIAGANVSISKGLTTIDLSSASSLGGSILSPGSAPSYGVINTRGGNFTQVAMSNSSTGAGGIVSFGNSLSLFSILYTTGDLKSGNILILGDHKTTTFTNSTTDDLTLVLPNMSTGGAVAGNIQIFAQAPAAGLLSVDSSGKVIGTITNSGKAIDQSKISLSFLTSSGRAGMSPTSANGEDGGNAGNISIQANFIQINGTILATGGGGGGGYGSTNVGFDGGKGGNGGNITIDAAGLAIGSFSGFATNSLAISSSGGGGGGGGGGFGSGGVGGAGGKAGSITINANGTVTNYPMTGETSIGFLSLNADLFAMDGGAGGDGGMGFVLGSGSGGGGGAAFGGNGGGGGGAGSAVNLTVSNGTGGGGGAAGGTFKTGFFTSTGFNGYSGGGGGGGGIKGSPSQGGSGAGYVGSSNLTITGPGFLLSSDGLGGSAGGDNTAGAAGGIGSSTGGGIGGTHDGITAAAGGDATTGSGGQGGTGVPILSGPGQNGSSSPFGPGNNGKISLSADSMILLFAIPFITPSLPSAFGGNVTVNAGSLEGDTGSPFAPSTVLQVTATNSADLTVVEGKLASYMAFHTPLLNVQLAGGSTPLERTLFTPSSGLGGGIPFVSGVNDSSAVTLNLSSDVDVTISGSGAVQLGNVSAPAFNITVTSAPLGGLFFGGAPDPDAPIAGSITILAGSKVDAGTVGLVAFSTTKAMASVSQQDPLTQFPITTSTLQLGIGDVPGGLNGNISVAAQSKTGNIDLTANTLGTAKIATVGPTSIVNSDINYLGVPVPQTNSAASFTLNTKADSNGNGAITIGASSTLTANTVVLSADSAITGSGGINQLDPLSLTTVFAKDMSFSSLGTSSAPGANDIHLNYSSSDKLAIVAVHSGGDATLANADGATQLNASTVTGNLSLDLQGILETKGNLTVGGDLLINAVGLSNQYYVSAASVTLNGNGSGLTTLSNGGDQLTSGVIEATGNNGNITVNSSLNSSISVDSGTSSNGLLKVSGPGAPQITFNLLSSNAASPATILFAGNQNFDGSTILKAAGANQAVVVDDKVLAKGNALVWIQSTKYIQVGSGQIIGNPLIFGSPGSAGTIANSGGNVTLPSNLTFAGSNLAILASGSINGTGLTSINLSGAFAGNLTMIAGYNFTPATSGQVGPVATNFTISGPSTGGSINLANVSINLSSLPQPSGSSAGNLIAIAHGGNITLGSIDASANGTNGIAGAVTIIGQNGVTVGSVKTTGTYAGAVSLSAADSQTLGTTVIGGGKILTGGFGAISGTFNNNIALNGNISAGASSVTVTTGNTGAITSSPGVVITASEVTLSSGTGGIGTAGTPISSNAALISANSTGDVYLATSTKTVSLGASSGNIFQLTSTSLGSTVTLAGALAANDVTFKSTSNGSFVLAAAIAGLNGGDSQKVVINANGTGSLTDLFQGAPTISATALQLSSGTGSFGTKANPLQINASTLKASTGNLTVGGGVYINDLNSGPVTINGLSSGINNSSIVYKGQASTLTISGQIAGNAISIDNDGAVDVTNKISGNGAVSVQAAGKLSTSSSIDGQTISLVTAAGSAGSLSIGGPLTSVGDIIVNSDGNISTTSTVTGSNITMTNTGSNGFVSIGGTITGTGLVSVMAKGNISSISSINGNGISLQTSAGSSGSVDLGGTLNSTAAINILSDSSISTSGSIVGTAITIANTGTSGTSKIGGPITGSGAVNITSKGALTTASTINGATVTLSTSPGSSGSIQIDGTVSGSADVTISSDNSIVTSGSIQSSAGNILLQNLGSSGSLTLGGPLSASKGSITAAGKGSLSSSSNVSGSSISISTATGSSGSVTLAGTLSSSGTVSIQSDNGITTTGSIKGVDINLKNSGNSGGAVLAGPIVGTGIVSVDAKGNILVTSDLSGSALSLTTQAGSSGSINLGGTTKSSTGITLVADNNISTTGTLDAGGQISVNTSGSITIGGTVNASGSVTASSKGTLKVNNPVSSSDTVNLSAQGNIDVSASVSGLNVLLTTVPGSNGNIIISANVSATDSNTANTGVSVIADGVGSITQTTGVISTAGSAISVQSNSGVIGTTTNPITLLSPTISANTSGNVFVLALSGLTVLNSSTGNNFNLTTTGDLSIPGFSGISANYVNLATLNDGDIIINGSINGTGGPTTNALAVSLNLSGKGTAQGFGSILANDLTLTAVSGDFGDSIFPLNTNAQTIKANTQGSIAINDTGAGTTTLLASTGNNLVLDASKIVIGAASNFAGTAVFNTSDFTNPAGTTFTAANIEINGLSFSPLTIKNGGTLVSTAADGHIAIASSNDQSLFIGNAGGPTPGAMQVTGGGLAEITLSAVGTSAASNNDIIFTGNQNFFGNTVMDASTGLGQVVQVNSGVTIQGFQAVTVLSNDLILNGVLIGNPLIFNSPSGAGTIANSQGDVLLSSDLIFQGQSLAIIASNNVLVTNPLGILIDLSNSSSSVNLGKGGTLSVLAGFNFSPATGGQVGPSGAVYAIANNPNAAGGSISLGSATIKTGTSVDGANSGSVLAAAHAGSQNNGSVTLGSIDTSNTGIGGAAGSVTVVAQGGATLGAITTTGSTDGSISVSAATPEIIGTISDQNGNFTGGGFVQPTPTTFSGNIVLSGISAGSASVTATTGAAGNITINDKSNISAGPVALTSGASGGLAIGKSVSLKSSTLTISAGSLGVAQGDNNSILDAPVLVVNTAGGDIGSKSQPLNITATTLTASAANNASVYLYDSANTDINLVNSGVLSNSSGNVFSLVALNPSGTNTKSGGGAQINAPHIVVESLNGNLDVAVNSAIANSIDFKALNGNIALSNSSISVVPDSSGNGGSISLNSATLTYTGSGLSALVLSANATGTGNGGKVSFVTSGTATFSIGKLAGNIIINATGGSVGSNAGNGGTAVVSTGGSLNFDPTQLNIVPSGNNGDGGKLSLNAGTVLSNAILNINTSSITENGVGIGNGGSVEITAPNVTYQNSGTLPLTLTANGGNSGNGGLISYITTSTSPLTVGSGSNSLNIAASSGTTGGNGGTVTVSTGGALTVAPENISAGPLGTSGAGATINLLAGNLLANSPLIVTGNLSAAAKGSAVGGTINLQSNSTTPFVILQATLPANNGTYGVLSVAGNAGNGSITVKNLSGGVTLSTTVRGPANNPALNAVSNLTFEAGAGDIIINSSIGKTGTTSVSLKAQGNITKSNAALLSSNKLTLEATTGSIGTTTTAFKTTANNLAVIAGQVANISNTSTALTLGASKASSASTFTLVNTGSITSTGDITAGSVKLTSGSNANIAIGGNITAQAATGSVSLTAGGKGSIFNQFASGLDRITGSSIVLKSTSGSIGLVGTSPVALRVTSGSITPTTSGSVNIDNASTAPLTIAGSASKSEVRLVTQGSLTISKPITAAKAISLATGNNGTIAINANLGGTNTTVVTVNAGGSGNISTAKSSVIISGKQSITLTSGSGNIGAGTTVTTAISTKTPLLSANTSGTGVVNLSDSIAGTLASSGSGGSFTLTGNNSLTIGKLSTVSGDISIVAKAGTLQTSPGSTITANNGALTLNNTNTAGKIIIGSNSTVQTLGVGGKDVKIVVGPIPTTPTTSATPTNVVTSTAGGGNIFFGTNGITGPTSTPVANVNAIGKNVIFSTNKAKASAITLNSGAIVTADPPVVGDVLISSGKIQTEAVTENGLNFDGSAIGTANGFTETSTTNGSLNTTVHASSSSNVKNVASYAIAMPSFYSAQVVHANIAAFDQNNASAAQNFVKAHNGMNSSNVPTARAHQNLQNTKSQETATDIIADFLTEFESDTAGFNNEQSASVARDLNSSAKFLTGGVSKVTIPNTFHMNGNSILFAPKQDLVVKTQVGNVKVDAGSVVLVMEHANGLTVFNFDDAHRGAVEITVNGKRIAIAPGRHCTIAFRDNFSEINPAQTIPHRNLVSSRTGDGRVMFESEFSLPAAFDRVEPISSLMASQKPHAKKLVSHMLKTAAVISQLNRSGVSYRQYTKPSLTAFAGN